jgi:serine/threonine protein phosphatase 1
MKRTFVIGDIHGCFDELMELTHLIHLQPEDELISLGDIVDRGNKSKEVFEYFRDRPNAVVLIGNHERKHMNGVLSYAQEIVKVQMGNDYPDFIKWLSALPYYYDTTEALIVHAALEPELPVHAQKEEVLCGSTAGEKWLEKKYGEGINWATLYNSSQPVIYGHHVKGDIPAIVNNTYGIDTGCCHGGFLTAIELPGFHIHQVKAKKDYWKDEQKRWQIPVLQSKDWDNMEVSVLHKQLDKLAYIEDPAVRQYLDELARNIQALTALLPVIKEKLDQFTADLLAQHPEDFNTAANSYLFKTYLFKSRANNLRVEDLEKSLNTANKIVSIANVLNIPVRW